MKFMIKNEMESWFCRRKRVNMIRSLKYEFKIIYLFINLLYYLQ